jgi:hypothetical protein
MAEIPSGTKFIGIDASIPTPELNGARINNKTQHYTVEDIAAFAGVGSEGPQGVEGPAGPPGPVGPAGLEWQGAWDTDSSYAVDDAVGFNGASWFCISEVTGTGNPNPEVDTTSWALLAAQGAVGPQGAQGPTGPQGPAGATGGVAYKEFTARIFQGNILNPITLTVIKNDFSSVPTVENDFGSPYDFVITLSNQFIVNKTVVQTNPERENIIISYPNNDNSTVSVNCYDFEGNNAAPTFFTITIKVYN